MLTPEEWISKRLPIWGAILGFVAGMFAAFVLNLPTRIFGQPTPIFARSAGVVAVVAVYFLLWIALAAVGRALGGSTPVAEKPVAARAA